MTRDIIHGDDVSDSVWIKRDLVYRISIYLLAPIISVFLFDFNFSKLGIAPPTFGQLREGLRLGILVFIIASIYKGMSPKIDGQFNVKRAVLWSAYFLVINAFFEELFYRGLLQTLITQFTLFPVNIMLSSAVFGIQHRLFFGCYYTDCIFYGVFGLLVGYVFHVTGNLIEVWIIHAFGDSALTIGRHLINGLRR